MTHFVPKLREVVPPTPDQLQALKDAGISFSQCNRGPTFVKPNANWLDHMNSLDPGAWTPAQLRLMADVIESNPAITLFSDGSGRRLDDPLDTQIDYDLTNWSNKPETAAEPTVDRPPDPVAKLVAPVVPVVSWTECAVRLGWFLRQADDLTPIWGPSICISSGGGPAEAVHTLRQQGYLGPVQVEAPPTHTEFRTGAPCIACADEAERLNSATLLANS